MSNPTTCDHNAHAQPLVAGRPTLCRKCGALIEPDPASVSASGGVHAGQLKPKYPGGHQG